VSSGNKKDAPKNKMVRKVEENDEKVEKGREN